MRPRIGWLLGVLGWLCACSGPDSGSDSDGGTAALRTIAPAEVGEADHVLDARDVVMFEGGHIEGAGNLDAGTLRATVAGVEGQVAARENAWAAFSAAGLEASDTVVVTAADNGTDPARGQGMDARPPG